MLKTTGARLFAALLGYVILIILLLTLNPFFIVLPDKITFKFETSLGNLYNNILLFLPLGFLYRMTTGRRDALVWGAVLSTLIELTQLFIPARTTSFIDVLANTLGAGVGSMFYELMAPRISVSPGLVSRFQLETPLMGLTYLLIPLLWVDTLALYEAPHHWLLTLVLGICGAIIISDVFHHWRGTADSKIMIYTALACGVWFSIGAGPRLVHSVHLLLIGLGVMLLSVVLTLIPRPAQERRFERNTLLRLLPVFILYLLLLALAFPSSAFGPWHAIFGFTDRITDSSLGSLYSRVEYLAAFTILGYLIAEWRGRLEHSLSKDLPRILLISAVVAGSLEIISGFQTVRGASIIRFLLVLLCAGFGGTIYHFSRAHIRFLLGR